MQNQEQALDKLSQLTERELEVLRERGKGSAISEVAAALHIENRTVKFHLNNIYEKLELRDVSSRAARLLRIQEYAQLLLEQGQEGGSAEPVLVEAQQPLNRLDVSTGETEARSSFNHLQLFATNWRLFLQALTERLAKIDALRSKRLLSRRSLVFMCTILSTAGLTFLLFNLASRSNIDTSTTENDQLSSISSTVDSFSAITTTVVNGNSLVNLAGADSVCEQKRTVEMFPAERFLRDQGVSIFSHDNTNGGVLSNFVRALHIDRSGLWVGFFAEDSNSPAGLGHYDGKQWQVCDFTDGETSANVNDIVMDVEGRIWSATESGVYMIGKDEEEIYTAGRGLPSNTTYSIGLDKDDNLWVSTWKGITKFNGEVWSVPYSLENATLFDNHVHALAFGSNGDIWAGHIAAGISRYKADEGRWIHYTKETSGLSGNSIRDILVYKSPNSIVESVWIATDDGGISQFKNEEWVVHQHPDDLPSNSVRDVASDGYGRIWAATSAGVVYDSNGQWLLYHSLDTLSIAFGVECQSCPFNDDHVWTGTRDRGLTHSRIPLPGEVIDVVEVTYPKIVSSGQQFRPEITVVPRAPYQLRADRGDFLSNTNRSDTHLFGAWPLMPVAGTVESGEPFTFTDYESLFTAPDLTGSSATEVFTSTWRVWMHTRYVGPPITIEFTVTEEVTETADLTDE